MKTGKINISDELKNLLMSFSVFKELDDSTVNIILENALLFQSDADEVVFNKGDSYHKGVYLILSGEVELDNGEGHSMNLERGDFVGLASFLGKFFYSFTAVSIVSSELIFIPELCLYKLIEHSSKFKERFYSLLVRRIDSFSGKKTASVESGTHKSVGSCMTSPVVTINGEETVVEAAKLMSAHKVGSLAVIDDNGQLTGLITSKHIVHRYVAGGGNTVPEVASIMDKPPLILPTEFPLSAGLGEMQSASQEYAFVIREGKPSGIISNNDIIKILFRNASVFSSYVEGITALEGLKQAFSALYKTASELMNSSRRTSDVLPMLSAIHLNIQKRVYFLTAKKFMEDTGFDVFKIRHSFIIMGSGGRREMMLDPDQDNGFIFGDEVTDEQIESFFLFGEMLTESLDYVGYTKCKGNVMVTNPEMSMRISDWKSGIRAWVDTSTGKNILRSNILFDFDCLAGDEKLVWELREYICRRIGEKPLFLIHLIENDMGLRRPVGFFGKFITEKNGENAGKMNMKVSALAFIIDVVRAFSLKFGLSDLNTIERLGHLRRKNILSDEITQQTADAYETITDIILNSQIKQAESGEVINKYINPDSLSVYNREKLRKALQHTSKFLSSGMKYFKGYP